MFSALEQPRAFEHSNKQDERDGEVHCERVEAAYKLAEVATVNSIRGCLQSGEQQQQNGEQTDAT